MKLNGNLKERVQSYPLMTNKRIRRDIAAARAPSAAAGSCIPCRVKTSLLSLPADRLWAAMLPAKPTSEMMCASRQNGQLAKMVCATSQNDVRSWQNDVRAISDVTDLPGKMMCALMCALMCAPVAGVPVAQRTLAKHGDFSIGGRKVFPWGRELPAHPAQTKTYRVRWPNAVSGHVTGFCREIRGFLTWPWSIWPSEVATDERRIS